MSNLSSNELANLIGELHSGRNPAWTEQAILTSPPKTAAQGVNLINGDDGGAINTYVQVRTRKVAAYRTAIYQITVANTDTYTIDFDGPTAAFPVGVVSVNFVSDGSATAEEIADGLKAAIEANGTLNAALLAYSEKDPVSGLFRLRVTGNPGSALDSDDFIVSAASSSGAGDLTVTADPSFCRITVWGYPGGDRASTALSADLSNYQAFADSDADTPAEETSPWQQTYLSVEPATAGLGTLEGKRYVHYGGYTDRLFTAGYSILAIQVVDITKPTGDLAGVTAFTPRVIIGPARRETNRPAGS